MPIYAVRCENGHDDEVFRSVARRDDPATCETCGAPSHRVMASFALRVDDTPAYSDELSPTTRLNSRNRAEFIPRMGGGKASLVKRTGAYRPACTHNTHCPKGHWANVAILNELSYGKRLACDRCGYTWLYNPTSAEYPLQLGYVAAYSLAQNYGAGMALGGRRYEGGARGA